MQKTFAALLSLIYLTPALASSLENYVENPCKPDEKPHIVMHIEEPILTGPLGGIVKASQEDYVAIVALIQHIQKENFPFTVVLRHQNQEPTLLLDTLKEFCALNIQHTGTLRYPCALTTPQARITGVKDTLDFLTPNNHGIWQEAKIDAEQNPAYFPIPAEGNIIPFYFANPSTRIKVISPFESADPMDSHFFEKIGQIVRFDPKKLSDPKYLTDFFRLYLKINHYEFIEK